CMQGVQLPYSF
nr:immunoglobulin light chain junction region [Macaca mulatta]MOW08345.1 immunoglobulin light chain junction region [Macaca mulatta]MOW08495.1 immunoglobulin light chain junction region [Macaca mulatta]MOW08729.1 immunoglobulin light chain junction region [Macaca mulatta]MOW09162.1 immunoglobulin light chain junction region [Macaca mulatta]